MNSKDMKPNVSMSVKSASKLRMDGPDQWGNSTITGVITKNTKFSLISNHGVFQCSSPRFLATTHVMPQTHTIFTPIGVPSQF